jgi:thiol-disulfide isomerase/thioredoxin
VSRTTLEANLLVIDGEVVQIETLRYTPAGIPLLSFVLRHLSEQVEAGKPLLIVYFSPECDHCQVFMKSFFKKADEFKNTQVLFITYLPLDRLVKFGSEYPLNKYKNIVAGTEGMTFVVRNFYEIKEMPFAVVYNKGGMLVGKYEREIPLDKVIPLLK